MPWWCYKHKQHSMDDMCSKCQEEYLLANATGELFDACEQARDTMKQISAIKMPSSVDLIVKRLTKAARVCDEAIRLALVEEE